jgi:sensor domain CHASE-containing protein
MGIRTKFIFLSAGWLIALIGLIAFISWGVVLSSFVKIEKDSLTAKLSQLSNFVINDSENLVRNNHDYAVWDDTYEFIFDGNQDYIDSNLVKETFLNLKVNVMLFINSKGELIYGNAYQNSNNDILPMAMPPDLIKYFSPGSSLLNYPDRDFSVDGLVSLESGPMVISYHVILDSEKSMPSRGLLVFGRYLDSEYLMINSGILDFSYDVQTYNAVHLPADFNEAKDNGVKDKIYVKIGTQNNIMAYESKADIFGQPAVILKAEVARKIFQAGLRDVGYMAGLLIILALFFCFLGYFINQRLLLKPVIRIEEFFANLNIEKLANYRLPAKGKDEIGILEANINLMLNELESAQKKLKNEKKRTEDHNRELEEINEKLIGREIKMMELKKELDALKKPK